MKYIKKVAEKELWNAGKVELYDFSRANQNEESRIEAVATVASVCYGKPPKDAKKLVERLWTESGGLPSSAFEFIRPTDPEMVLESDLYINDPSDAYGIRYSLRNWEELPTDEEWVNGNRNVMQEELVKWHKEEIATFRLTVPIFVRSQIVRHRTMSFQELSRRFTTDKQVPFRFWMPDDGEEEVSRKMIDGLHFVASSLYKDLVEKYGYRPEVARAVLPQSLYTTLWVQGDVPAWKNYFKLRLDKHTQKEHRDLAQAMLNLLEEHQPELWRKVRP